MTSNSESKPKDWADFVSDHPSAADLDSQYHELLKMSFAKDDIVNTFQSLQSSPASVLISYNERNRDVRLTHNHSVLGDALSGSERQLVGIQNLSKNARPIVFETSEFRVSQETTVPPLKEFINANSSNEIEPSSLRSATTKAKISSCFILPPFLAQVAVENWLTTSDLSVKPKSLLIDFIQHIKLNLIEDDASEEDINTEFKKFEPLLHFLWVISPPLVAMHQTLLPP